MPNFKSTSVHHCIIGKSESNELDDILRGVKEGKLHNEDVRSRLVVITIAIRNQSKKRDGKKL
jgi:hypothetical protein